MKSFWIFLLIDFGLRDYDFASTDFADIRLAC